MIWLTSSLFFIFVRIMLGVYNLNVHGTPLHQNIFFLLLHVLHYVSRWHLKCFVKLWVAIDLVEYHHSPVVKVPVLGL